MPKRSLIALAIVSVITLVTVMPAFSAGQQASDESAMRLAWWGNPTRDARTEGAVERYMEIYPDSDIELETVGWGGYWDRINTQAAAGSLPDLMQHDYSVIYDWVQRGLLTDLTPYLESGAIQTNDIPDSFLDGGRFSDGIYGISLGTNALSLVYDVEVLAEAGIEAPDSTSWTWDDFEQIALTVYEETGMQTMPIYSGDPRHGLENMILQTGQHLFNQDGTGLGFTDTSVLREFFEIQLRLKDAGALVSPEVAFVSVTPDEGLLAMGETWTEWIWSNQLASTQAVAPNDLAMALIPQIDSAQRPGTYLKPSMFFSVTSQAQNPDEAVRFLDFFVNDVELNQEVLMAERGVPIPTDVRQTLIDDVDDVNRRIFEFIDLAGNHSSPIPLPDPANSAEVIDLIRETTISVLMERISVDEGIDQIMTEANRILAR